MNSKQTLRTFSQLLVAGAVLVPLVSLAGRAKVPPSPIERRQLRTSVGKPFERKSAKLRVLPVASGGVFVSNIPILGGNAVVGTAPKHWGMPTDWSLVDLKTGRRRAKTKNLGEGSSATKTAVIPLGATETSRPALLDLTTGKITEPVPILPDNAKVKDIRVVVDRKRAVTWLFARRADGRPFQGEWKDLSNPKVELTDEMAFWPAHLSGRNGIQVWTDSPRGGTGGCDRIVLDPKDPWRCRPLTSVDAAPQDLVEDCVRSDGEAWVLDDCGAPPPPACGERARALLMSPDPSRALAVCTDDPQHAKFVLWSPKRSWVWEDEPGASWKAVSPERAPHSVVGMEQFTKAHAAVRHWLDATNGILYEGPPMQAVQLSEHRDDRRRLVQPPDKLNELWLLDLDAGTLERVANDIDCDTTLYTYAQVGDRTTIECLPKALESTVYKDEARLASWKWMEVVDFKARTRWRTTEVFEAKIGADGSVVGTKRGKPASLAVVETP